MHPLRAGQIKAARALLDWSQEDLAQSAGLSVNTIRNLETGVISPRGATTDVIRRAIESAGLEFIEPEGVRRRVDEVKIFQGPDSCDMFFHDILQTVREKDGEIVCIVRSQKMLMQCCGAAAGEEFERLERLSEVATVKCLLSEELEPPFLVLPCQSRTVSRHIAGPISYYVYGDKHAAAVTEDDKNFKFVAFRSVSLAQSYRARFLALWDTASPLLIQASSPERRIRT